MMKTGFKSSEMLQFVSFGRFSPASSEEIRQGSLHDLSILKANAKGSLAHSSLRQLNGKTDNITRLVY